MRRHLNESDFDIYEAQADRLELDLESALEHAVDLFDDAALAAERASGARKARLLALSAWAEGLANIHIPPLEEVGKKRRRPSKK